MKSANLVLSAASYSAALAAVFFWPAGAEGRLPGKSRTVLRAGETPGTAGKTGTGAAGSSGADGEVSRQAGGVTPADAAAASTGPAPTMDEVFQAAGLGRMLLMARFIQTATPAELEEAIDRSQAEGFSDTTFQDQLWLRWVELDREAALRHKPPGTVWWALAKLDPDAALEAGLKGGREALGSVLFSIAQGNPARARQLLSEHPEADPRRVEMGMVEGLGKTDPAAAMTLALEKNSYSIESRFRAWMNEDSAQATAWMKEVQNPVQRRQLEDVAFSRLLSDDPAAGLEAARQLPAGLRQLTRSAQAIAALADQDPAAARAAAEAMPTPQGKQRALAALAGVLSASADPGAVASILPALDWTELAAANQTGWEYAGGDGSSSSGSIGEDISGPLMSQLMTAVPRETLGALAAMDPGRNGPLMVQAVRVWADREPEAASSWLRDLPEGPSRDMGIDGLNGWLLNGPQPDYSAALAWAGSASAEKRDSLIDTTLQTWKEKDPQAAAAAVSTLPVSEERKAELLKNLNLP